MSADVHLYDTTQRDDSRQDGIEASWEAIHDACTYGLFTSGI